MPYKQWFDSAFRYSYKCARKLKTEQINKQEGINIGKEEKNRL